MKKPRSIKNQSVSLSCHEEPGSQKRTINIKVKNAAMPAAQAITLRERLSQMIHWCG